MIAAKMVFVRFFGGGGQITNPPVATCLLDSLKVLLTRVRSGFLNADSEGTVRSFTICV